MSCETAFPSRILNGVLCLPQSFNISYDKTRAKVAIPDATKDHVDNIFSIQIVFNETGVIRNTTELKKADLLAKGQSEIVISFVGNTYIAVITNFDYDERAGTREGTFFNYSVSASVVRRI